MCRGSPVGVYATSAATPLYFAQAVGRFVRARAPRRDGDHLPADRAHLLAHASALELERDHALDRDTEPEMLDDDLLASEQREESASERLLEAFEWTALESDAEFDHALYDGHAFGTTALPGSDEELDFIGILRHPRARPGARVATPASGTSGTPYSRAAAAAGFPGAVPHPGRAAQAAALARRHARKGLRRAARPHPRRAAAGVRRPGGLQGDRRPTAGPDRPPAAGPVIERSRDPL